MNNKSEMGSNGNSVLQVRNLTKTYKQGKIPIKALDNVSFDVKKGEFLSIVGPSGSGKSTLLSMIGLLDRATSGRIFIEGDDVTKTNESKIHKIRREKIGFIFQNFNLLGILTALENVEISMQLSGVSKKKRKERAVELLVQMGLEDRLKHRPSELSGGQQQRVAIARCLANNPPIILADEPTGSVDTKTRDIIVKILRNLSTNGQTVLIVTHDMNVSKWTDRIITMQDGKIVIDSSLKEGTIKTKFCYNCGCENEIDHIFCPNCGISIKNVIDM